MSAAPVVMQLRSSAGLYGADRMVLSLNAGLAATGLRSRLLCVHNYRMQRQELFDAANAQGQDVADLPCRGRLDMGTVRALRRHIAATDANIVHVHDYKSAFYAWLATRGRRLARVATLHGWVGATTSLRLYNTMELALLRRFDALAIVAEPQRAVLLRHRVPAEHVHVMDNGIDLPTAAGDRVGARAALGLSQDAFVIAAVARLSAEKNLSLLIDVMARLVAGQDVVLLVAGDGPERAALEEQARALGISSTVHLLGQRDDIAAMWPAFDVLALPSLTEGMPLVVLEALAHGVPVVASRVGEVPRLLSHSPASILVEPGNADALEDALRAAIARGPGLRDTGAARHVREHHSTESMSRRYGALYASLLESGHARRSA